MKFFVIVIAVLALAGGGIFWYVRDAKGTGEAPPPSAQVARGDLRVSVQATGSVASNNDVDIKVQASGKVERVPVDISEEVSPGQLLMTIDPVDQQRLVEQAKAQLENDDTRISSAKLAWEVAKLNLITSRQRAKATLASMEAKATDSYAKRDRTKALFEEKLTSKEDLETAQTAALQVTAELELAKAALAELDQQAIEVDAKFQDIKGLEAQRKQNVAKLEVAERGLEYCVVTAPKLAATDSWWNTDMSEAKWTVSGITAKVGSTVQSSTSNVSGGAAVMTLSDLSRIFVLATVDESDIGQVQKGQRVEITSDSYRGVKFDGKVVRIATKGVSTNNVVTFEVKIEVTSPNRMLLKPMMTANVDIISMEKKDVLMVPMNAVARKGRDEHPEAHPATQATVVAQEADGGSDEPAAIAPAQETRRGKKDKGMPRYIPGPQAGTATVLKTDGTKETRDVVMGLDDEVHYEIISGLNEGETVLLNKGGANSRFSGGGNRRAMRSVGGG
jgi:HlyD family secretion protein